MEMVKQPNVKLWHDRQRNQIRIRIPNKGTISIPYDEEVYKKLKEARTEYVESASKEESKPRTTVTDVSLWNTFIARRRPLIEELIAKVGWFQSAILDIGANTMLLITLISDPEEAEKLPELIGKLKDKDEFVGYVMNKLIALYQSAKGFEEVAKLRERVTELEAENALLTEVVARLKGVTEELRRRLDIALSIMNSDELRRYAKVLTLQGIGETLKTVSLQVKSPPRLEKEGEVGVEGG